MPQARNEGGAMIGGMSSEAAAGGRERDTTCFGHWDPDPRPHHHHHSICLPVDRLETW